MHVFHDSFQRGIVGEKAIADFMRSKGYDIEVLPVDAQKAYGYDLHCEASDFTYQLEVKTEYQAELTGNIFFETQVGNKPGWCIMYQSLTNVHIVWYLPKSHRALTLPANRLLDIPFDKYPRRVARNPGYQAVGHLIPLPVIESIAIEWLLPPRESDETGKESDETEVE